MRYETTDTRRYNPDDRDRPGNGRYDRLRMRHGSLFSGIGGFDLAAEWMGWTNIFHCEWNQFGQKVLKYYWPEAISYDDICKTDFTIHRGHIDILTGGFPCQPYSMAGKRKGTEDSRHLWPEMLRAIRECRPTWIVGENVHGLINWSGGLVFEQVCAELEGEGYEVQPVVLPASGVNAPHRRDRVWIVAYSQHNGNSKRAGEVFKAETRQELEAQRYEVHEPEFTIDEWSTEVLPPLIKNPNEDGRGGDERKEESSIGQLGNIGAGDNERVRDDNEETGDAANAKRTGQQERNTTSEPTRKGHDTGLHPADWTDWPTVAPLCDGNDGFRSTLDGITFPKWRNESIKAAGNAVVPQVVLQVFKVIEQIQNLNQ